LKRLFDIFVSATGLLFLSPLLLLLSIAIKLDSPGPVFYRGVRVGQHGKPFKIYKFRSMVTEAEMIGSASTSNTDSRITRTGKIIRKFKLDEFSQLMNVLIGDMSIVGPRPQVQWAVDTFTEEQRKVLVLRPGITDWASIRFHNEGDIISASGIADPDEAYMKLIHPEKMRLQLEYLQKRSFFIDIKIIWQTISTLFITRIADVELTRDKEK
jgi:lipopolysaccharide/colanic/teichoic acid biosynthesis glycosyltransferase